MNEKRESSYRSFLLRCWREENDVDRVIWRYSIEDISGQQQRHGFGCLEGLINFLQTELTTAENQPIDEKGV